MRIYMTHCSAKKDASLKGTNNEVTPDRLCTATPLQRFVNKCREKEVQWAVFSTKHGVWFPHEKHKWYEKDPGTVSESEFKELLKSFQEKLGNYEEICFYHNPGRFHSLYKKLVKEAKVRGRILMFTHLSEIV
jgi:hypothetical protein